MLGGRTRPTATGPPASTASTSTRAARASNVTLKDFAIIGDIQERVDDDQVNALGGAMSNSTVDDLWMQHTKVGAWMDGPMDNFTIKNSRILDQTADGVNFHIGVTNSTVTNTFVRNTGDDGLAMWAENMPNVEQLVHPQHGGRCRSWRTTSSRYGGKDITITDNVMADTITNGGGMHVANRYPGVNPARHRGRGHHHGRPQHADPHRQLRLQLAVRRRRDLVRRAQRAVNRPTINITDTDILDSSYAAIQWIEGETNGVNFNNINIDGAGTYALQVAGRRPRRRSRTSRPRNIAQTQPDLQLRRRRLRRSPRAAATPAGTPPTAVLRPVADAAAGAAATTAADHPPTTAARRPPRRPTTPPTAPPARATWPQGQPVTATSTTQTYTARNAVDGNAASYWESANNAFPQSLTVDLGAAARPSTGWC